MQSKPIEQVLAIEDTNWTFSTALPERHAVLDRATVKGSQYAPPLMEVRGRISSSSLYAGRLFISS